MSQDLYGGLRRVFQKAFMYLECPDMTGSSNHTLLSPMTLVSQDQYWGLRRVFQKTFMYLECPGMTGCSNQAFVS